MPLPGYGNNTSSDGFTGGQKYTRMGGPLLVGQIADNVGPLYSPGAVMLVQSTAPILTQVASTLAASIPKTAFMYITQTSASVSTSSFASGESAPPYSACGAALVWDAGRSKLGVYSTVSGSGVWLWSSGAFTSS